MKRNILFLILALPVLSLFSGCDESSLELNPNDQMSSATFWKSKADFDLGLTACYGVMTNQITNREEVFTLDLPIYDSFTDLAYSWANFLQNQQQIAQGQITPTTGGFQSNIYGVAYMNIARFNIFLKQLDGYTGSDISDAQRNQYKSEALFLRAYMYYYLWTYYGDVPLVLEPLTLENQDKPKATAAEVLAQILKDLDFSIANNKNDTYYKAANMGQVGKPAAQALKARLLIYDAFTNGSYHPGGAAPDVAKLTVVRDLCKDIMANSGHSLSPVFENVFRQKTQATSPEIIFSTIFLEPNVCVFTDLFYADWYAVSPLPSFVADFECTDGLLPTVSPLYNPANKLANRDPRLTATVFNPGAPASNTPINWEYEGNFTNYHTPSNSNQANYGGIRKFCTPTNVPYDWGSKSGQDWVFIRYAEVVLMFAEAQNELFGADGSVYDAINSIRQRQAYPGAVIMPALPAGLSKEQMRVKIRHERKMELAFEGFRYFDLKRWGVAGEVLNNISDNLIKCHWDNKFYKWPLPQSEIDKSKGILIQNPDYK